MGVSRAGLASWLPIIPVPNANYPYSTEIVAGPDGGFWFTEYLGGKIGRVSTGRQVAEFSIPWAGTPAGIVTGPDGNLWFADQDGKSLGRVTPTGDITQYNLTTQASGIATGSDRNLWFTEPQAGKIGRFVVP